MGTFVPPVPHSAALMRNDSLCKIQGKMMKNQRDRKIRNYVPTHLHAGRLQIQEGYALSARMRKERDEWPSGSANFINFTEVKHGCVRSETGWGTFRMNDQNSLLGRPSEGTLN